MKLLPTIFMKVYNFTWLLLFFNVFTLTDSSFRSELDDYVERRLENFKLKLHNTLEDSRIHRTRSIAEQSTYETSHIIAERTAFNVSNHSVVVWCKVNIHGVEIVFAGSAQGSISILLNSSLIPLFSFPSHEPIYNLLGFQYSNGLWLVGLHRNKPYIQVYEYISNDKPAIVPRQQMNSSEENLISIVRMKEEIYLVSISVNGFDTQLNLFLFTGTQFDLKISSKLYHKCNSLTAWGTDGSLFMVVSLHDRKLLKAFQYSPYFRQLKSVQVLEGSFLVLRNFQAFGNQYLIGGEETKIRIYWWSGVSFQEQSEILISAGESLVDISLLNLSEDIYIIVVALNGRLEYYLQEKPDLYVKRGSTLDLEDGKLKSIFVWENGNEYFILPVFLDYTSVVYHLNIIITDASSVEKLSNFEDCMVYLDDGLNITHKNIEEFSRRVKNIWTKGDNAPVSMVTVNGAVISGQNASIEEVTFKSDLKSSISSIVDFYEEFYDRVTDLKLSLKHIVSKTADQNINGSIKFHNGINILSGSIDQLENNPSINDVHSTSLDSALKITGQQKFPSGVSVSNAKVSNVNTVNLNYTKIEDYVLLKKQQVIEGNFVFKNVSVSDMIIQDQTLNGIEIDDLVRSSKNQTVYGTKRFSLLNSFSAVTGNNIVGVDMTAFIKFIPKNTANYKAKLNFTSDIKVANINLQSFNGYNFSHLILDSVKTSENQNITGWKTFDKYVDITDTLSVFGHVNKVYLEQLMTLRTPQTLTGNVTFTNVSFGSLETHSVNNVDLCLEAVRSSGHFRLNKTRFLKPIKVSSITIKDGVFLNSMDLSSEMPNILTRKDHIFNNTFEVSNLIVRHNIEIADGEIVNLLEKLSSELWFKTKPQNVKYGHLRRMDVNNLKVKMINGILLEDIIRTDSDSTIDSIKQFEDAEIHSVRIHAGKTLNGIDFTSKYLPPLIAAYLQKFRVPVMMIEGNLNISTLNSLNLSDLMLVQGFQDISGIKILDGIYLKNLLAYNLDFSKFFRVNFTNFKNGAVSFPPKRRIINKHFNSLKGKEMNVRGLLNEEKIETLKSAVTLDTRQNITSYIQFVDSLDLRSMHALHFPVVNFSNVVLTDKLEHNIYYKEFRSVFIADNVNVKSKVNGINIVDLKSNAFTKGDNNYLSKPMNFKSSMTVADIQVISPGTIDHIQLNDCIKVDDNIHSKDFTFSTINSKNVNVTGKINECNISEIYDLVYRTSKIAFSTFFTDLNIDGNLHVKALNNMDYNKFSEILSVLRTNTIFVGNAGFFEITATNLQILNSANGIYIDFLLRDAVKQDTLEDIKGLKVFRRKISSSQTTVNALNVTFLCGVNIPLLYKKYVSKKENQTILIKSLPQVRARNICIGGFLNGLNLPYDVVLIDTNETISSPLLFNNSLNTTSLYVAGKLNGVHILHFVDYAISLKERGNISSVLIFLRDVPITGNLEIEHLINNISLKEVARMIDAPDIHGLKTFQKSLSIKSHLNLLSTINDISLDQLADKLYRIDEKETITDMVIFTNLHVPNMDVKYINNISPNDLHNQIHDIEENVENYLHTVTDLILVHNHMLDTINHSSMIPVSLYGFFELHQVLNLGSTSRFLPVFEYGVFGDSYELPTPQMIVWIDRNDTCRSFKSVQVAVSPTGKLEEIKRVFYGRVFPFTLRVIEEDVQGFTLHTDRYKKCTDNKKRPDVLKTLYLNEDESKYVILSPPGSIVLDVRLLETDDEIYLIIAYEFEGDGERMHLYRYSDEDTWLFHLKFHSWHITSFDIIFVDDLEKAETHLVVTGTNQNPGIFLYQWDFENRFFYLSTSTLKSVSSSALWVSNGRDVFLLLAKEKTRIRKDYGWLPVYSEPVEVYILRDDLKLDHAINIQGIHSFERFEIAGEIYVLAVSRQLQTIYVIQHRGCNGFEVIQEISAPGVVGVTVFASTNNDLLVAVSSNTGHSRILKCFVRGGILGNH